jgi:cytochrome P450
MSRPPVDDWSSDFDHLDPRWIEDPYPIWESLREKCPIAHTARYRGVYFPSRYEDVRAVAYDTEHFSSRRIIVRETPPPRIPAPPITSDPPEHRPAKNLLLPAFTPDAIKRHEPQARAICARLIDRFAGKAGCDVAVDYAQEIPARIIAHMLGLPDDEGERFRRWIHEILELGITEPAMLMKALGESSKYFAAEVEKRRAQPTDDLISYLAHATIDGAPLSEDHLLGTIRLILIAGIDTTWSRSSFRPRSRSSCARSRRSPWRARWSRRPRSTAVRSSRAKWCCCRSRPQTAIPPFSPTPSGW